MPVITPENDSISQGMYNACEVYNVPYHHVYIAFPCLKILQWVHTHTCTHTASNAGLVEAVMGVIFTFVVWLLLITLMATGYHFVHTVTTITTTTKTTTKTTIDVPCFVHLSLHLTTGTTSWTDR